MKVRTLVARLLGGAITPKNYWRLYAENAVAALRRKSGGAITPKTKWLLYAGNSHLCPEIALRLRPAIWLLKDLEGRLVAVDQI